MNAEANAACCPVFGAQPVVYTQHEHYDSDLYRSVTSSDAAGNAIGLQTPHCPDSSNRWQKLGVWYGSETRIDAQGRRWDSTLPCDYVQDDFGNLVEVRA